MRCAAVKYKVGDKVIFTSQKRTKYKFCPQSGSVGTVLGFNNRGILIQWNQDGDWDGRGWCRYGEIQRQTPLDEFFSSFI